MSLLILILVVLVILALSLYAVDLLVPSPLTQPMGNLIKVVLIAIAIVVVVSRSGLL